MINANHSVKNLTKVAKSEGSIVYKTRLDHYGLVYVKKYEEKIFDWCFEYIVREINILLRINHPNIVKLLEIWPDGTVPTLVFENGGSDLWNFSHNTSRHKKMEWFKPVFGQTLNAIDYLHTNNIIHRDIKSSNILININGNVIPSMPVIKICDFGLSRSLAGNMSPRTYTPNYRAPELLEESDGYNTKIDIWALGCVIYEYIEQDILFKGATSENTSQNDAIILKNIKHRLSDEFIKWMFNPTRYAKTQHGDLPVYQTLTEQILSYDPNNRPTANECLVLLNYENPVHLVANPIFLIRKTTSIDLNIRHVIVANLISLDNYYDINYETIALSIDIYDKWLMLTLGNDDLILYSLAAVILASHSYTIMERSEFASVYTEEIILDATKDMFKTIGYNTNYKDLWTIMLEVVNIHELPLSDNHIALYWKNTSDLLLDYNEIFAKTEKDIKILLDKIIA